MLLHFIKCTRHVACYRTVGAHRRTQPNVAASVRIVEKSCYASHRYGNAMRTWTSRANGAVIMKNVTFPLIKWTHLIVHMAHSSSEELLLMDMCVLCVSAQSTGVDTCRIPYSEHGRFVKWDLVEVDLSLWSNANAPICYIARRRPYLCVPCRCCTYMLRTHVCMWSSSIAVAHFWQASSRSFTTVSAKTRINKTPFQTTLLTAGHFSTVIEPVLWL